MRKLFSSNKPLLLASASPRRQEYFRELGLDFTVSTPNINEAVRSSEHPDDFVKRLAFEKADAVMKNFADSWVVAADTVVCLDEQIMGKPNDAREAHEMLRRLSDRTHTVRTGVCAGCRKEDVLEVFSVQTVVRFAKLSEEIIKSYVATGEPFDKAGSYGIQGTGAFLVTDIAGSYSNVVGLPLTQTLSLLMANDVILPA